MKQKRHSLLRTYRHSHFLFLSSGNWHSKLVWKIYSKDDCLSHHYIPSPFPVNDVWNLRSSVWQEVNTISSTHRTTLVICSPTFTQLRHYLYHSGRMFLFQSRVWEFEYSAGNHHTLWLYELYRLAVIGPLTHKEPGISSWLREYSYTVHHSCLLYCALQC